MELFIDQLQSEIRLDRVPRRIVSLVPSQTELLYDLGLEDEVVGELVVEDEVIVVTEAAHEACKHALGLTDANIALFESALADGTLFNKGPQSANGTEFGASRWDAYANCVSNYVNPF